VIGIFEGDPAVRKWAGRRKLHKYDTWDDLVEAARAGIVDTVVVASVGSVARTAGQLDEALRELDDLAVRFVAVAEKFEGDDLVTRAVIAALVKAEAETRTAGVMAGIEEKKKRVAAGLDTWNFGRPSEARLTPEVRQKIYQMVDAKVKKVEIARRLKLSRQSVYNALRERDEGLE
jgi:DNA invertase Pin-like site-specific DNA recombinase